jgi:hypothetical protein
LHTGSFDALVLDDLLSAYERAGVRWIGLDETLDDPAYAEDVRLPPRPEPAGSGGGSSAIGATTPRSRHYPPPPLELLAQVRR